jgi:hypothetical protein
VSKTLCRQAAGFAAGIFFAVGAAHGAATAPKFLGANSCANSSCHGGGGQNQNQFLTWSLKDFHSQRPAATLTTARAKQIADALEVKDPTDNARCTVCHAPLHEVPENLRGEDFKISEGVSCESCHGASENWLRSHTRTDYTRADRTAAGMRDLQNLYVRANTCVACHQNVDADILKAGHPELIFELDGQSVAEPKHWSAEKNGDGAQAWLVGQAVALREMSWQLANEKSPTQNQIYRWAALVWLVETAAPKNGQKSAPPTTPAEVVKMARQIQPEMDKDAHDATDEISTQELTNSTRAMLSLLDKTSGEFQDSSVALPLQARRAERLVLALDRLVGALPELKNNAPVQSSLNQLFQLAQSVPDFDPKPFADALQKFSAALAASTVPLR